MPGKKTAIITGASGDIGAALVEGFLREGHNVVGTFREANRKLITSGSLVSPMAILATSERLPVLSMQRSTTSEASTFWFLMLLTPAWRKLFTLLTRHKGRPDPARKSHLRVAGLPPPGIRSLPVCCSPPSAGITLDL